MNMLLGKRPRAPMRRTTSMSSLGSDCSIDNPPEETQKPPGEEDCPAPSSNGLMVVEETSGFHGGQGVAVGVPIQRGVLRALRTFPQVGNPRPHRRRSSEPPHFLQACFLCRRRLVPGKDIYMYMGDSAFCSIECRNQQIELDERQEKCSVVVRKKDPASTNQHQNSGNQNAHAETVAAA